MAGRVRHSAASSSVQPAGVEAKGGRAFGTVYYVSGEQYKGEWRDNKRHGQGVVTYKNGDKYGGEWQDGKRHGNGTLWVLQEGRYKVRYSGDWQYDLPEGSGVYFDDEGNSYEGEFQAGLRHGRGRAVACSGGGSADSSIKGSSTGAAAAAGDVYEGCWQHDKRHGPGTLMLANGDMYEGHWEDDAKHGSGTFFYMSKGCRYDGVWHQGTPKCGTYSEIQPAPPGTPGSIPNIELADPGQILQEAATAAAAGADMAVAAAEAAAAALAAIDGFQHWVQQQQQQQYTACTVTASGAAGQEEDGDVGGCPSHQLFDLQY